MPLWSSNPNEPVDQWAKKLSDFLTVSHNSDGTLKGGGGGGAGTLAQTLAAGNDAAGASMTNLGAPSNQADAATKGYVDGITFNNQSASYTLVLSDQGKCINFTGSAAQTLTVPTNANVPFPTSPQTTRIAVCQAGTGSVTIQGDTGVTIAKLSTASLTIAGQYGEVVLTKRGTDAWRLNGDC